MGLIISARRHCFFVEAIALNGVRYFGNALITGNRFLHFRAAEVVQCSKRVSIQRAFRFLSNLVVF